MRDLSAPVAGAVTGLLLAAVVWLAPVLTAERSTTYASDGPHELLVADGENATGLSLRIELPALAHPALLQPGAEVELSTRSGGTPARLEVRLSLDGERLATDVVTAEAGAVNRTAVDQPASLEPGRSRVLLLEATLTGDPGVARATVGPLVATLQHADTDGDGVPEAVEWIPGLHTGVLALLVGGTGGAAALWGLPRLNRGSKP